MKSRASNTGGNSEVKQEGRWEHIQLNLLLKPPMFFGFMMTSTGRLTGKTENIHKDISASVELSSADRENRSREKRSWNISRFLSFHSDVTKSNEVPSRIQIQTNQPPKRWGRTRPRGHQKAKNKKEEYIGATKVQATASEEIWTRQNGDKT